MTLPHVFNIIDKDRDTGKTNDASISKNKVTPLHS